MRSPLLVLTLAALSTLACKREDTTAPTESATPTSEPASEPVSETSEPSPEVLELCTHMGKLMQADLAGTMEVTDEQVAENAKQCSADIETKRAAMSAEQWDSQRACIMAAQTLEAAVACG
jgi:hypothetical protein